MPAPSRRITAPLHHCALLLLLLLPPCGGLGRE